MMLNAIFEVGTVQRRIISLGVVFTRGEVDLTPEHVLHVDPRPFEALKQVGGAVMQRQNYRLFRPSLSTKPFDVCQNVCAHPRPRLFVSIR